MPSIPKRLTLRSQILALTLAVSLPAAAAVVWALSLVLDSEKEAAIARVRSTSVSETAWISRSPTFRVRVSSMPPNWPSTRARRTGCCSTQAVPSP